MFFRHSKFNNAFMEDLRFRAAVNDVCVFLALEDLPELFFAADKIFVHLDAEVSASAACSHALLALGALELLLLFEVIVEDGAAREPI